jgi:hypothetical protein
VDNNQQGCLAEYLFATECMKRNYQVSMPLMDSSLYDCIVDTGKQLLRIQIKSSAKIPENDRHSNVHIPLQNNKRNYTKEKIDYFAVWSDFFNGWFVFKNTGDMQSIRVSITGKNKKFFNNFAFE